MAAYAKFFGENDDIKMDNEINEKNYTDRMHLALHRRYCRAVLGTYSLTYSTVQSPS